MDIYKLSCSLNNHTMDVHCVASGVSDNGKCFIVSGSRDRFVKIWMPGNVEEQTTMEVVQTCKGHTNVVSCICIMKPNSKYPNGLILSGSHDHTILGFELGKLTPIIKLSGHIGTVSSLAVTNDFLLISGSCDMTAKVWKDKKNIATLKDHQDAIWAVATIPGADHKILTASDDKEIRLWKNYQTNRVYRGHTDCVRALVVVNENQFLSGSNDAQIRLWNIDSSVSLNTFSGHTNFIYCLSILHGTSNFVSGGEDSTIRIWENGQCSQIIQLPSTTIWSVTTLENGDIITGSSDGIVRIFSKDPSRIGPYELIEYFEEQVNKFKIQNPQNNQQEVNVQRTFSLFPNKLVEGSLGSSSQIQDNIEKLTLEEFRWNVLLILLNRFPNGLNLNKLENEYCKVSGKWIKPNMFGNSNYEWKDVFEKTNLKKYFKILKYLSFNFIVPRVSRSDDEFLEIWENSNFTKISLVRTTMENLFKMTGLTPTHPDIYGRYEIDPEKLNKTQISKLEHYLQMNKGNKEPTLSTRIDSNSSSRIEVEIKNPMTHEISSNSDQNPNENQDLENNSSNSKESNKKKRKRSSKIVLETETRPNSTISRGANKRRIKLTYKAKQLSTLGGGQKNIKKKRKKGEPSSLTNLQIILDNNGSNNSIVQAETGPKVVEEIDEGEDNSTKVKDRHIFKVQEEKVEDNPADVKDIPIVEVEQVEDKDSDFDSDSDSEISQHSDRTTLVDSDSDHEERKDSAF